MRCSAWMVFFRGKIYLIMPLRQTLQSKDLKHKNITKKLPLFEEGREVFLTKKTSEGVGECIRQE